MLFHKHSKPSRHLNQRRVKIVYLTLLLAVPVITQTSRPRWFRSLKVPSAKFKSAMNWPRDAHLIVQVIMDLERVNMKNAARRLKVKLVFASRMGEVGAALILDALRVQETKVFVLLMEVESVAPQMDAINLQFPLVKF